jgi:DNA-3-methyladenine glycosylase
VNPHRPLPRAFYARPAPEVARDLLGARLVRREGAGLLGGRIVETEAYLGPGDRASHARSGPTRRNRPMFGPPGRAYVYRVYGLHWCLNVVTGRDGEAEAVLIRAALPLEGIDEQRRRRNRPDDPVERLAAGPARLCEALGVDGALDGHDLTAGERLWIAPADPTGQNPTRTAVEGIVVGPRVGVGYAGEPWATQPLRFGLREHPALSRPFRAVSSSATSRVHPRAG